MIKCKECITGESPFHDTCLKCHGKTVIKVTFGKKEKPPELPKILNHTETGSQTRQEDIKLDRKKHAIDMIQPRRSGEPNPEFLKHYPQHSAKHYSKEEMKYAEKKLKTARF